MSETQALLSEIEAYAKELGMAPSTFCERAVGNSKLAKRLQEGGSVTFKTAAAIRAFVAQTKAQTASAA